MSTAVNASRLGQMKARFQQKQMQEKEEKLTRLYETQQQRTLDRVVTSRTSSRNATTVTRNNTMGYSSGETSPGALSSSGSSTLSTQLGGGGRVRQMFEERRTHTKAAGIDKSYPLEPIKGAKSTTNRTERTTSLDRNSTFTKGHSKFNLTSKRVIDNQQYNSNTTLNYHNNNEINNKQDNYNESNDFDSSDIENHNDTDEQIMNKHNLFETSLDDEMFPDVQLIDDDLDATFGKLSNSTNLLRRKIPTSNERLNALATRAQPKRSEPIKPHHEKLTHSKSNGISSNVEKLPLQRSNTVQQRRKQQLGDGDSVRNSTNSKLSSRNSVSNGRKVATMNKVSTPPKKVMPTPISSLKKIQSPSVTPRQSPLKSPATTPIKAEMKIASPSAKSPSKIGTTNSIKSATPRRTLANSVSDDNLKPCRNCSRRFASDRLQKHEEICMKTASKKRKPYDALKHRVLGTEAEAFVTKPGKNAKQAAPVKKNQPDWRRKHEEFIQAIRAAKQVQAHLAAGGNIRDLPPPPPSTNPDYVQCPHCGRKFNEGAAERHIPKCANYSFNKPKTVANKNGIKKR